MESTENQTASIPAYQNRLGKEQAKQVLKLFSEIENGKYNKNELHEIRLNDINYPLFIRAIRADMQSFVNTFIDPYLNKKPYLRDAKFVIDAGANIGFTAILFANWWPDAKIISIEPDFENYTLTIKNTENFPNISVLHGGLWNNEALLQIEAGQEDGFVVREISGDGEGIKMENLTQGISLDSLLKKYDITQIDFLKMNIEGSEKEVFSKNYCSWLSKTNAMLIELHDGKNAGCSKAVFSAAGQFEFAVTETAAYGVLFTKETLYRNWYAKWYREEIYQPNINKERFPEFYLDKE